MLPYKAHAHIHSLKGEMREITVLDNTDNNRYIVEYGGVKCTAVFNWFVCEFYADDVCGIIKGEIIMNRYKILKNKQEKEMNAFPFGVAFNDKQFIEMMNKWGLTKNDTDQILSLGAGCFIRKSDHAAYHEMIDRFEKEKKAAIAEDQSGEGFIRDMFYYELSNHEYRYSYEPDDALEVLGLTIDQVYADRRLDVGLYKAENDYHKDYE